MVTQRGRESSLAAIPRALDLVEEAAWEVRRAANSGLITDDQRQEGLQAVATLEQTLREKRDSLLYPDGGPRRELNATKRLEVG